MTDTETLSIVRQYGWYIDKAFEFRKREIEKQITGARKTLADEASDERNHARHKAAYESLEYMAEHLEHIQREFNQAHDALKEAGIK